MSHLTSYRSHSTPLSQYSHRTFWILLEDLLLLPSYSQSSYELAILRTSFSTPTPYHLPLHAYINNYYFHIPFLESREKTSF